MKTWHYSTGDEPVGPIDEQELLRLVRAGDIGPEDRVWSEHQTDWTPARNVPGLFAPPLVAPKPTGPQSALLVAAPQLKPVHVEPDPESADLGDAFEPRPRFFSFRGRIGRSRFLFQMAAIVLPAVLFLQATTVPSDHPIRAIPWIYLMALVPFPQVKRLHDIGHSGAVAFLNFIPGVNLALQAYLLLRPGTRGLNLFGPDPRDTSSTVGLESVVAQVAQNRENADRFYEQSSRILTYTVDAPGGKATAIDGSRLPAGETLLRRHVMRHKRVPDGTGQKRMVDARVAVLTDHHMIDYTFERAPDVYNAIPVRYDEVEDVVLSHDQTSLTLLTPVGGIQWPLGSETTAFYKEITARRSGLG